MVSALSAHEEHLAVLAPGAVVGQRDLECRVHCGRAAHREEHLREALLRQKLQDLLCEGVRQRVRRVEARCEVQPANAMRCKYADINTDK